MALKRIKSVQQIKVFNSDTIGVEKLFNSWRNRQEDIVIEDMKITGTGSDMILIILYTKVIEWADHTIDDDLYKIIEGH